MNKLRLALALTLSLALVGCGGLGDVGRFFERVIVRPIDRTVNALDDRLQLRLDVGTFTTEVAFLFARAAGVPALPLLLLATAFDVRIEGGRPQRAIEVRVAYDERSLPEGTTEANLRLFRMVEGQSMLIPGSRAVVEENVVVAEVEDLDGTYVVGSNPS